MPSTHTDPGIYRRFQPHSGPPRGAVFLDRDGVIVEETGYLHKLEDVRLLPSVAEAIARLNSVHCPVIVITNQAGVGRGYYGWTEFEAVEAHIEAELARSGAHVDGVWACAYHADGIPPYNCDHPYRKPHPGMLKDASQALGVDLPRSWLVGDKISDIEAGLNAQLQGTVLVRTGYGREHQAHLPQRPQVHVADTLLDAVEHLILTHIRL